MGSFLRVSSTPIQSVRGQPGKNQKEQQTGSVLWSTAVYLEKCNVATILFEAQRTQPINEI